MTNPQSRFVTSLIQLVAQAIGALLGLVIVLLAASALRWITPVWAGGSALFPLYFGAVVLVVGSVPFMMVASLIFTLRSKSITARGFFLLGLIQGIALLPLAFFLRIAFPSYFYEGPSRGLLPLWAALALAGVLSTIVGALLIPATPSDKPPSSGASGTLTV